MPRRSLPSFSIRKLFRSGSAEAPPSGGDRRRAQKLVDQGIAAETSGSPDKALDCYRRAVAADAGYAPAHMNLGIALQAIGDLNAAIASYERAIVVDPEYAAAHFNLARAHLLHSQHSQAEAEFRIALRIRDDFPEAWVGLAGALEARGRDEDALLALDRAIALRGDYAGALLNSIALLKKLGRIEAAIATSRRVLELEPENYFAHGTLGASLHTQGDLPEAESSYRQALAFNPDYSEAKANLALVLQAMGRIQEAISLLFESVAAEPNNAQLRGYLGEALSGFALSSAGERERTILLSLCADDNTSTRNLNPSIVALSKGTEGFRLLQESARRGDDPLGSVAPAVAAFMREPLLLAALPRMPISDPALEEVLTHLRRKLLLRLDPARGAAPAVPEVPAEFICALARQCFFSGYAFFADETELQQVAVLREALEDTLREAIAEPRALEPALSVALLYDSLPTLKGFERLLEIPMADWSEAFRPLVQEQLENRQREQAIARELASITPIDDQISLAVRAQYEEHPYPRWVSIQRPSAKSIETLAAELRPGTKVRVRSRPVPILVAGCGTGHDPIQIAMGHPESEILAVDLSLTSLAYASRMTDKLGITNITYRQADILKLGELARQFAIVECCGVLHHLDDPMAGWRVLLGLLEPDGLMRIALYSEKARSSIVAAQEFTRSLNVPPTADGIRRCRHAIAELPDGHPARKVLSYGDFCTLEGCRDMLMHVQEHRFTLPRIETCLDQLGLQFLSIDCTTATRNRFREKFPDSDADRSLGAWDEFEDAYPDTFLGMYSFWCCRK